MKKIAPSNPPSAYSYIRFSTPEQLKGDSLRRQTEAATEWCSRNKAHLDTSLTLHDLGRSAFTGEHRRNPDRNALAAFLKAVEGGRVPRGSYLIIENLDRLSREHIRPALTLLLNLIESGIRVVQLKPAEQVYGEDVEPMQLMMAIMELSRGHSESKMKSERIGAAWQAKLARARANGEVVTRCVPAWIDVRGGKLHLIPERAAAVRRIFDLARAGYGSLAIARKLAAESMPAIGRSGKWYRCYITLILRDRRTVGEFQPCDGDRRKTGDPIPGYFPAVVTEEEWLAARSAVSQRRHKPGRIGKRVNIFSGLLRNARAGDTYFMFCGGGKKHGGPILINHGAAEGKDRRWSFPYPVFEVAVLAMLREVDPKEVTGRADGPDEVMVVAGQLSEVEAELSEATAFMEVSGFSPTIGKRIQSLEERKRDLAGKLADARQKASSPLSETWGEMKSLASVLDNADDPHDARMRLRSALRKAIDSIWLLVANRGRDRLCTAQIWFHGGERFRNYKVLYRPPKANQHGKNTPGRVWVESIRYYNIREVIDIRKREDAEYELEHLLHWNPEREEGGRFLLKGTIIEDRIVWTDEDD